MFFFVLVATIAHGFITWQTEDSIRISGYVLQALGMFLAIRGLLRIRAYFKLPSLNKLTIDWLNEFPKWKGTDVSIIPGISLEVTPGIVRSELWCPDNPEKTMEERIECIVFNLEGLRKTNKIQFRIIDKLTDSHEAHKKEALLQSTKVKEDIRTELETLHTSDLIISLIGLLWLLVGITLSTMAPELYKWLN